MKTKVTLLLTFFLVAFTANAQEVDCATELSLYADAAKNKKYDEAYDFLVKLRKDCPSFHKAIYLYGEPVLMYKIENAKSEEDKKEKLSDLMLLFDEFDKNFPNNGRGNKVKKALALFDTKLGTNDEVFAILDEAFKTDKENFTDARAMYIYFEIFVDDFEAAKKGIELQ